MENELIYNTDTSCLPSISVIIPAYNAEKYIERCLKCITNQNYPKEKMEIIVVDNNSSDNTAHIIKSFDVRYIFNEIKGPSASRNMGITQANGEYIIFTDSDCLADNNFVLNHVKAHLYFKKNNPNVKLVGGGIGGFNKNFWAVCDDFCSWAAHHPGLKSQLGRSHFPSANISIPTKLVEEIGVFNEELQIGEDIEYCLRIENKGYKMYFEPKAKVLHINRETFSEFMGHGKSWAKFVVENRNRNIYDTSKIKRLLTLILNYIVSILTVIACGVAVKRFYVILFIPFIILYKTYFTYYRLKSIREFQQCKIN